MYPSAILLTLYNTLVTPHLHYCLLCWGSIIKENELLHIMQKKEYLLPTIKHKYAENSIRYCFIRQLKSEVTWASTVEIKNMVFTTPYPRFKTSIKNKIIDSYKERCVKRTEDCFVCTRLRLF